VSNLDQEKDLTNTAEPETDTTIKDQQVQDAPTDEKSVEQSKQEDPRTQSEDEETTATNQADAIALLTQQWEQERTSLVNQLFRLKADFDNYKRRMETNIETIRATANENLMAELLPVVDNFERALQAMPADSPYTSGVQMIYTQLLDCLQKQGLTPIAAVGQKFDPNFHEAVSFEGDLADNLIVTAELRKGYLFKNKLLRASMVQVAPDKQQEEE